MSAISPTTNYNFPPIEQLPKANVSAQQEGLNLLKKIEALSELLERTLLSSAPNKEEEVLLLEEQLEEALGTLKSLLPGKNSPPLSGSTLNTEEIQAIKNVEAYFKDNVVYYVNQYYRNPNPKTAVALANVFNKYKFPSYIKSCIQEYNNSNS